MHGARRIGANGSFTKLAASAAMAAALAACGGGAGVEGDPPEPARAARLAVEAFDVAPGEEGLMCQTFANPFGEDAEVARWAADLTEGGHHVLVFEVEGGADEPLAPCGGNDFTHPIVFQGQSAGEQSMRYPEGIAALLPATSALRVQVHYLNTSPETVRVQNAVELELAPEGEDLAHVAPLRFENFQIAVPAAGEATVSKTCKLAEDTELVWVVSHMHSHGVGFELAAGDEALYATDTWADPPAGVFDPPRVLAAGSEVRFSCSYVNASADPVTFGTSLQDDEMCVMVGGYVARGGERPLLECEGGAGECLPCMMAVIQQAPEALCADDGPPSSKDVYDALQACTCGAGPDGCAAACGDSACAAALPSDACMACIDAQCAAQKTACFGGAAP